MRLFDTIGSVSAAALLTGLSRIAEDGSYVSPNLCHAGGIQTQVGAQQAPAVAGDFASGNPRFFVMAGPGGLVCGDNGLYIARFAWTSDEYIDQDNAPTIANNTGFGVPDGLVHREQQGLITTYLSDAGMFIPKGFPVTLFSGGDLWVQNDGTTTCTRGMKAFADLATGKVSFAAAGASPGQAASVTASIAAGSASVTGEIVGNLMTVSAVSSGILYPGATLSGTDVVSGTKIVEQLSGTAGGVGTYAVSIAEQSVAAGTTITAAHGVMTVTAVGSGALFVGGVLAGTSVVTGTQLTALGIGADAGLYIVDNNTVVTSTTITETQNIETKWIAMSQGAAGELVKITDHPLG